MLETDIAIRVVEFVLTVCGAVYATWRFLMSRLRKVAEQVAETVVSKAVDKLKSEVASKAALEATNTSLNELKATVAGVDQKTDQVLFLLAGRK